MKPKRRVSLAVKLNIMIVAMLLIMAYGLVAILYRVQCDNIDEIYSRNAEQYAKLALDVVPPEDIALLIKAPSGSGFPSTHSALAGAATTALLVKKRSLGFVALALTVCIAFSRLYLYVHYPTDVLCGLLLGVLCGVISVMVIKALKLDDKLKAR